MSFDKKFYPGHSTSLGTTTFKDRAIRKGVHESHFKLVEDLYLSSLGMGTYLGNLSSTDNENLESSLYKSVKEGCINVIDTALNYRSMLSEKSIGRAVDRLMKEGIVQRNELFICTKNGYFTNDGDYNHVDIESYLKVMYIDRNIVDYGDISPSYNIMNPDYIANCIDRSLCNMGLESIDLVYIHNSFESWYDQVEKETYNEMLSKVFKVYEEYRKRGKIRYYGMATWNCFTAQPRNPNYLSLRDVVRIANEVGGTDNGFKFIQLPYNSLMTEAFTYRNQKVEESSEDVSILEAANRLGIHVFTSIPLFQGKLLILKINDRFLSNLPYESLRLLQFVRSTPGIVAPLVGQKSSDHTNQNILISRYPTLTHSEFEDVLNRFESVRKNQFR